MLVDVVAQTHPFSASHALATALAQEYVTKWRDPWERGPLETWTDFYVCVTVRFLLPVHSSLHAEIRVVNLHLSADTFCIASLGSCT